MALRANTKRDVRRGDSFGRDVAASAHIYDGAAVAINASGYLVPCSNTAGLRFDGFNLFGREADNSAGANGALNIRVDRPEIAKVKHSGIVAADKGKPVWFSDDQTVTLTPGFVFAGIVHYVESETEVWIDCEPAYDDKDFGEDDPLWFNVELDCDSDAATTSKTIIPLSRNPNGMVLVNAFAQVTEVFGEASEDQGIVTLEDSDGSSLSVTFTPSNAGADALNDVVAASGVLAVSGTTGQALAVIAAGKGLKAAVTQQTSGSNHAGKLRIYASVIRTSGS